MRVPKRILAALALTFVVAAGRSTLTEPHGSQFPATPDDRTIVHVLNRLTFGPAPGDIDRVRSLGLQAYIEQQLRPERIDDKALQARLAELETLSQSTQ